MGAIDALKHDPTLEIQLVGQRKLLESIWRIVGTRGDG